MTKSVVNPGKAYLPRHSSSWYGSIIYQSILKYRYNWSDSPTKILFYKKSSGIISTLYFFTFFLKNKIWKSIISKIEKIILQKIHEQITDRYKIFASAILMNPTKLLSVKIEFKDVYACYFFFHSIIVEFTFLFSRR